MFQHQISMATLAGHGMGAKVALAAACYHFDKVTGVCLLDTSPMNQFYHEANQELRSYLNELKSLKLSRPYSAITHDLRSII